MKLTPFQYCTKATLHQRDEFVTSSENQPNQNEVQTDRISLLKPIKVGIKVGSEKHPEDCLPCFRMWDLKYKVEISVAIMIVQEI